MTSREKYISQVHGQKKERDYTILELHALLPHLEHQEIIDTLNLDIGVSSVSVILKKNSALKYKMFMDMNPLVSTEGRAFELAKLITKKIPAGSRKDVTDILEQLRKEIIGDKPLIDQSIHTTYQQVKVVIDDNSNISSALKSRVSPTRPEQI